MQYLLDTNIWIVYLKEISGEIRRRLEQTAPADIAVWSVVWAELLHSARKYEKREVREHRIEVTLDPFVCLPFDLNSARRYAHIRDQLEKKGETIGGNDMMIAAIALANDPAVVTNNVREFNRVEGLRVEDWSVPSPPTS
jgi:tRNA(fMet)-specific endonuclease VapC